METVIDKDDLLLVSQIRGSWQATTFGKSPFWYVKCDTVAEGNRRTVLMHRLIMNADEGLVVDHINHDTLDNRKQNLRVVTTGQNLQNLNGARIDNKTSGIRGVYRILGRNRWYVCIGVNGKSKYIGSYLDKESAEFAAKEARSELLPYSVD